MRGWTGPVARLRGCATGRFPERVRLDRLMAEQRTENENQEYNDANFSYEGSENQARIADP